LLLVAAESVELVLEAVESQQATNPAHHCSTGRQGGEL